MSFIIVWRSTHQEPHIDIDMHGFAETYSTIEDAKQAAETTLEQEGPKNPWYFDYAIFEEVNK